MDTSRPQSHPHQESTIFRVSIENPLHSGVAICFHKKDRLYRIHDVLSGHVVIYAKDGWHHKDIYLQVQGEVNVSVPGFGTTEKNSSTLYLLCNNLLLKKAGKLHSGAHQIPFAFPIVDSNGCALLESCNGTHINITYVLIIKVERGFFNPRPLETKKEFILQLQKGPLVETNTASTKEVVDINNLLSHVTSIQPSHKSIHINSISHESIASPTICESPNPVFSISGILQDMLPNCNINLPLRGELIVEHCDSPISNIEIQLIRFESVSRDVQDLNGLFLPSPSSHNMDTYRTTNILRKSKKDILKQEIAYGNVLRDVPLPIYMNFPRLNACASFVSAFFCIEFQFNIVISFESGHVVTECIPLVLNRG